MRQCYPFNVLSRFSCHRRKYSLHFSAEIGQSDTRCHGFGAKFLLLKMTGIGSCCDRKFAFKSAHMPQWGVLAFTTANGDRKV